MDLFLLIRLAVLTTLTTYGRRAGLKCDRDRQDGGIMEACLKINTEREGGRTKVCR